MASDTVSASDIRIRAHLFGSFLIEGDGLSSAPLSRKARAIIAYLLLSGREMVARERLAALLWGDRGEEQARASLRQALYELRAYARGSPFVEIRRHDVRLVAKAVTTDLEALQALADGADAQAVATLIGDPPGVLLEDCDGINEAFDDWLAAERARWLDQRLGIAIAVGRRALAGGEAAAADGLATRLHAADPFGEAPVRLAMEARAHLGDRDGVRRAFHRYAEALRRELCEPPPPEMVALCERLTGPDALPAALSPVVRPFAAPQPPAPKPTQQPPPSPLPSPPSDTGSPRRARRRVLFGGAVAFMVTAAGIGTVLLLDPGRVPSQHDLVVQPLRARPGDSAAGLLGDGLASDIARMAVGNVSNLSIVDATDPGAHPARADFLIESQARTLQGQIHASIRLIDRASGQIVWSQSLSRTVTEIDGLRDQIAARVTDVATCGFGHQGPKTGALDTDTLRLLLAACEEQHGDLAQAAKLLHGVVERAPKFAHGWALLAASTMGYAIWLPNGAPASLLRQGLGQARHALVLDPNEGRAYDALANGLPKMSQWPERYALEMKGHALDTDDGLLPLDLAIDLFSVGRFAEGAAFSNRAMELDPFNEAGYVFAVRYLGYGGQLYALPALQEQAHRFWPDSRVIPRLVFACRARGGDPEGALKMLQRSSDALGMDDKTVALFTAVLQAQIDPKPGKVAVAIARVQADAKTEDPDELVSAAGLLTLLGRNDLAMATLLRVRRPLDFPFALFYGYLAPLRADPRFMIVAARQGLIDVWRRTNRWPDFCGDPHLAYDCRKVATGLTEKPLA